MPVKNIAFRYQYRDRFNHRRGGEVIFANPANFSLLALDKLIKDSFKGGEFIAKEIGVPELFFPDTTTDDVDTHEYVGVEATDEEVTDEEVTDERTIGVFVQELLALIKCEDCGSQAVMQSYGKSYCQLHSPLLPNSTTKKPEKVGDIRI